MCIVKDAVVEVLRRTTIHFVHCVLPQHNAGLCDLKMSATASATDGKTSSRDDIMLNVPLVRAQIRGAQLVDAVRLHRQGSHCLAFLSSWFCFRLLGAGKLLPARSVYVGVQTL